MGSAFIIVSHQFLRCANLGTRVALPGTERTDNRLCLGVINMSAVPRKQIIHFVNRSQGNVSCIVLRGGRQGAFPNECVGKVVRFFDDLKCLQVAERFDPAAGSVRIAALDLLLNQWRYEEFKTRPARVPLLTRHLLTCCRQQVTRGARGQVAQDGCFHVHRLHSLYIADSGAVVISGRTLRP